MNGIATAPVSVGPAYIFRNVFSASHWTPYPGGDSDALLEPGHFKDKGRPPTLNRGNFAKLGEMPKGGSGRQYWLHNTVLQPAPPPGKKFSLGAKGGINVTGHTGRISELVSLNNILHIVEDQSASIYAGTVPEKSNTFDFDLYNGKLQMVPAGSEAEGIHTVPPYAPGHGPEGGRHGKYQLAPGSPGYDEGKCIPNFNDDFHGHAPDIGAHEGGSPPMKFGEQAESSLRKT